MALKDTPLRRVGGRTCLDFVNTANWSATGALIEDKFETDADVAAWCRDTGLGGAGGSLEAVRQFRGALRGVLVARMQDQDPDAADVARLNGALAALPAQVIPPNRPGLDPALTLEQAVSISAAALLGRASEIERVKICPGNDCAWMFLDESKNRRRTWCSMETCGNRAKAKRHYRRRSKSAD